MPRNSSLRAIPLALALAMATAIFLTGPAKALSTQNSDDAALVLADMALSRGDCRGGTERYLKAAMATDDARIAQRAAKVAADCQQVTSAAKAARRWQRLDPESADAAAAVALAAVRLYQPEEAGQALLRAHQLGGDEALIKLIGEVSDAGGNAIALDALRPSFESPQVSERLLGAGIELSLEAFDFATARKLADRMLASDPASGVARAQLARVLTAEGDEVAAIAIAQEAAALEPESERFAYADTLLRLDRYDEARRELESIRADPSAAEEAEMRLAKLAYQAGELGEAGRRFSSLLGSRESTAEAVFFLSNIAEREGEEEAALKGYSELIEFGAGLVVRGRAARLLLKRGDRVAAFRLLDEIATKERSEALDVELAKAALLEDVGQPREAVALLKLALEEYPGHPGIRMQMALIQERAGLTADSVRLLEKLLQERPQDASVQNALGYSLADHNQKLPRAEALIRKALEASPDNPAFLDSLGWVRFRRGDVAGAMPYLQRAYRIFPDAEVAAHLGELLWVSGKQDEARQLWDKALARAPDSKPLRSTIERLTGKPPAPPARKTEPVPETPPPPVQAPTSVSS